MNNLSEYWAGYIAAFIGWLFSLLFPISHFLLFVTFLVLFDLITGTRAAIKRGEKLASRKLTRTVEKLVLYYIAILAARGMGLVFFNTEDLNVTPITYAVAFAIAITEFQSNVENVETVTGVNIWKETKGFFKRNNKKNDI